MLETLRDFSVNPFAAADIVLYEEGEDLHKENVGWMDGSNKQWTFTEETSVLSCVKPKYY